MPQLAYSFPDMNVMFAGMLGGQELLIILAVILLLFGGSKLPSLARGLGQSIKEFKKGAREDDEPQQKSKTAVEAPSKQ
jgi:sec-independent protein translocase protein TatA